MHPNFAKFLFFFFFFFYFLVRLCVCVLSALSQFYATYTPKSISLQFTVYPSQPLLVYDSMSIHVVYV